MGTPPFTQTPDGSFSSHTMSSGAPQISNGDHPPPWQQSHQWQAYGPPPHHYPYAQMPPHHCSSAPPPPISYYHPQARYTTPATEAPAQAPPIYDLTQDEDEHREMVRSREHSPSTSSWPNLGTDWSFLRQHILDMSEVLLQTMCPVSFGPHNTGRYHVILLLRQKSPECWQAGVTCDGRIVIEAPERICKQDAMMTLSEVIAAKLGQCIIREWEPEDARTDVEEGSDGSKFAIDFKR